MKTIRLYGHLGVRFGRVFRLDVASPAEAVRALLMQLPGFRDALLASEGAGGYRVVAGGAARDMDTMADPCGARESIRIVPVLCGAGKKGIGQILLGAALIGFGIWTGGANLAFGAAWKAGGMQLAGYFATSIGMSLVMGGISQMLVGTPSTVDASVERPENKPSYAFDGAVNTAAQGNPVPVCYGRMIVGSQVISAGMSVEQI
ncbi:MAG: tail assembly protein [Rhodocyclaceae bacterium]|nr:tail assembly protein [Rhodocyclaceae bacterium]